MVGRISIMSKKLREKFGVIGNSSISLLFTFQSGLKSLRFNDIGSMCSFLFLKWRLLFCLSYKYREDRSDIQMCICGPTKWQLQVKRKFGILPGPRLGPWVVSPQGKLAEGCSESKSECYSKVRPITLLLRWHWLEYGNTNIASTWKSHCYFMLVPLQIRT